MVSPGIPDGVVDGAGRAGDAFLAKVARRINATRQSVETAACRPAPLRPRLRGAIVQPAGRRRAAETSDLIRKSREEFGTGGGPSARGVSLAPRTRTAWGREH